MASGGMVLDNKRTAPGRAAIMQRDGGAPYCRSHRFLVLLGALRCYILDVRKYCFHLLFTCLNLMVHIKVG